MKTRTTQIIALVAVIMFTLGVSVAQMQEDGWEIGPRNLPLPVVGVSGVSDEFYEFLSNVPQPDVEASMNEKPPQTDEEWEAHISERDASTAEVALQLAEVLSVTVEREVISGVNVHRLTPPEIAPEHANHLYIHVHGGAFIYNSGDAGILEGILIASHLKIPVISIDYRRAPKYPAPAAVEDVTAVWQYLLENEPSTAKAMGGTSAGGAIAVGAVQHLKELGLELPQALMVGTPGADLTGLGDSRFINTGIDHVLVTWGAEAVAAVGLYNRDIGDLTDPRVSVVYGDFSGFPPTYLISGTRDLNLSDTVRVHRQLRRAGVEADLHVYEGQSHGDYIGAMTSPESFEHFAEVNAFLLEHLETPFSSPPATETEPLEGIEIPPSALR